MRRSLAELVADINITFHGSMVSWDTRSAKIVAGNCSSVKLFSFQGWRPWGISSSQRALPERGVPAASHKHIWVVPNMVGGWKWVGFRSGPGHPIIVHGDDSVRANHLLMYNSRKIYTSSDVTPWF
ncbi:hypothetical protein DIRU0_B10836 [Diutina rugosa]